MTSYPPAAAPPASAPDASGHLRSYHDASRTKDATTTARRIAAAPAVSERLTRRRMGAGLLSRARPIAAGSRTMQASANQGIPRIAHTAPTNVRARVAPSKTFNRLHLA